MTVDTQSHPGALKQTIKVSTNDPRNSMVNLVVNANVERELVVNPLFFRFEEIPKEDVVRHSQLTNVSDKPIRLQSIKAGNDFIEAAADTDVIQPGKTAELTMRILHSKVPQRMINSWVSIQTDIPYLSEIRLWVQIIKLF